MAKKNKKSQTLEVALGKFFLEQMLSTQVTKGTDAKAVKGLYEHAKAANEADAKRAEVENDQMKALYLAFETQQEEIAELKRNLNHAIKKIKSMKADVEKHGNRNAVLSNQLLELDHELSFLQKKAKKQKTETKQLTVIVKSLGSVLRICKMSDSLDKAKNKFLDAASEAKEFRRHNKHLFGDTLKVIDGEYREVPR